MKIDAQLWAAYADPYFRFQSPVKCRCFAIITAWNPASVWLSNEENDRNNRQLRRDIDHNYYVDVLVGDEMFSWAEESFAVEVSLQKAVELGRKFGQNAVYYAESEELFLVSCDEIETKLALGKWQLRCR